MNFVTADHVYALADADFSDLPVLAIDTDGEIVIYPQCTATERGARILTDAAVLPEYTDGEDLNDTPAERVAADTHESLDPTGHGDAEEWRGGRARRPRLTQATEPPATKVGGFPVGRTLRVVRRGGANCHGTCLYRKDKAA